jgi:DNA-binding MarR family transcriptional regulator
MSAESELAMLSTVNQASTASLGVVIRSLAPALEQVTLQQYRVLALLVTRGPLRASDLAAELGVLPSGVSRIVNRLVRSNYVQRRANQRSGREILIAARAKATHLVENVLVRRQSIFKQTFQYLSADERDVVRRAAQILIDAVAANGPLPPIEPSAATSDPLGQEREAASRDAEGPPTETRD